MSLDRNIFALIEPSIMPTPVEFNSADEENGEDRQTRKIGVVQPYVLINNYQFYRTDIVSFRLMLSGKIPEVQITLSDRQGNFKIDSYPRDGDVVTVFINSLNQDTYKSIHMDFDIVNVSDRAQISSENNMQFTIRGVAKIPRIYSEECKSFEAGTSLDHLTFEATDLGLGLASNIDQSSDQQPRIQAYVTHLDFINEIVDGSYISDDSFQIWFVDQWYYLNFVDVNRIFNAEKPDIEGMEDSLISFQVTLAEDAETSVDNDNAPTKLILTNNFKFKGYNNYIEEYRLVNNSSEVALSHGVFRDVGIWNDVDQSLDQFRLDPLTSDNMLDFEEPLRGRRSEDRYLDQVKNKWLGRQDVGAEGIGNVHQNHLYSKIHNVRNRIEAGKMKLIVTLGSFNPALYKYQMVPVIMYHYDPGAIKNQRVVDAKRKDQGFSDQYIEFNESDDPKVVIDQFLTGYYIIENIDLTYKRSNGLMLQELTLIRREWPTRIGDI